MGFVKISKLALFTMLLFTVTIAVGGIGLAYYYSYRSALVLIAKPAKLGDVLLKISSLQYKAYVSPSGDTYYVNIVINATSNLTRITATNPYGNVIGSVLFHYNATNITWALVNYSGINENLSGSNLSAYVNEILTSITTNYNPTTGTITVSFFPGLGPLYDLYYYSSYYGIDWQSMLEGQPGPSAVSVGYIFTPVKFDGKSYAGVTMSISPTSSLFGTFGAYTLSATMINFKGAPLAVQIVVGTGGPNYVSMSVLGASAP
ncbi:MAG: hypothetical protein ACP5HK_05480 [Acidilobus sp.]